MTDKWPEGSPQAEAIAHPDQDIPGMPDQFDTANEQRAWWDHYFASPYPLVTMDAEGNITSLDPLPGSMVLTKDEYAQVKSEQDGFTNALRQQAAALHAAPPTPEAVDRRPIYIGNIERVPLAKRSKAQLQSLITNLTAYLAAKS